MTLENIYYLSQTAAVTAIIGSLIILIIQVRHTNNLTKRAAIREQLEGLQDMAKPLFEENGLADIYHRGEQSVHDLTDVERERFLAYWTFCLRKWEAIHALHILGDADESVWDRQIMQLRGVMLLSADIEEIWKYLRHSFSPPFQQEIDTILGDVSKLKSDPSLSGDEELFKALVQEQSIETK